METIGSRIRTRRTEKQWTLPKLAKEAGVAKGYLWELENDKALKPSVAMLFKIAAVLGTTVADLLGEARRPDRSGDIPPELADLAAAEQLTDDDVVMLAGISYRGERPRTVEDWKFVLESIRRSVKKRTKDSLRHARGRHTWRSAEAQELMAATGNADPVAAIKDLAAQLLLRGEQTSPPVDLPLLASLQDVLRIETASIREAGRLVPTSEGLLVQIKESDSAGRQNFTIAHELGHTLLPSYHRQPAARNEATVGSFPVSNEEEYLCDVAASAILLPEPWIRSRSVELGQSLASILELADTFRSSLEATALAWTQLDIWPVAVVVWEERLKPAERRAMMQPGLPGMSAPAPVERFRISRFFRSPSFPHFLPKEKSVDDGAVIELAVKQQKAEGEITLTIGKATITLGCEAIHAPYRQAETMVSRVLSVVFPVGA